MPVTLLAGDVHANRKVMQAIADLTHAVDGTYLDLGDMGDNEELAYARQALGSSPHSKVREHLKKRVFSLWNSGMRSYEGIDRMFATHKNSPHGILGNHDLPAARKSLQNINMIGFKTANVNGMQIAGVYHTSHNFHDPDEDEYASLEANMTFTEEAFRDSDMVLMHKIPDPDFSDDPNHQGLCTMIQQSEVHVAGAHVHEPKHLINGRMVLRSTLSGPNAALYALNHDDAGVYKMTKEQLLKASQGKVEWTKVGTH